MFRLRLASVQIPPGLRRLQGAIRGAAFDRCLRGSTGRLGSGASELGMQTWAGTLLIARGETSGGMIP